MEEEACGVPNKKLKDMSEVCRKVMCSNCGKEFSTEMKACPYCGCEEKTAQITFREKFSVNEEERLKGKSSERIKSKGKSRPAIETVSGIEYNRDIRKNVRVYRIINRKQDEYLERISDTDTGEVIHSCNEPLSCHTGHGADRNESSND